ncbi:hypothetical protein OSJ57_09660 [Sphingomonas sp. HH69]
MRMLSKFVAASALSAFVAIAAPAQAEEAGKQRFTHEGYTYVYEVIPRFIDQNPCAQSRRPMDMIFHGRSTS